MINVILIGFMGCGKTTFGKWLADKQQMDFLDTDEFIESMEGRKISDIFAMDGEEYFRNLETETLKMLLGKIKGKEEYRIRKSTVISVGGGLPVRKENQELLKKLGKVVFLDTSIDELLHRLEGDTTRPLLKGGELRERIEKLMEARYDIYEDVADIIVGTDSRTLNGIYKELMNEWE